MRKICTRIIFEKISIIEIIEELEAVLSNSIGFILKICKKGWEEMQKLTAIRSFLTMDGCIIILPFS